jgi:nucleoside 2-deoxyribosyltransferase
VTRDELLQLHHDLTHQLAESHRVLGVELARERRSKTETYAAHSGTDKERTNAAQFNSMDITEVVFREMRECDALVAEIENVRLQLAYGGFTE